MGNRISLKVTQCIGSRLRTDPVDPLNWGQPAFSTITLNSNRTDYEFLGNYLQEENDFGLESHSLSVTGDREIPSLGKALTRLVI